MAEVNGIVAEVEDVLDFGSEDVLGEEVDANRRARFEGEELGVGGVGELKGENRLERG